MKCCYYVIVRFCVHSAVARFFYFYIHNWSLRRAHVQQPLTLRYVQRVIWPWTKFEKASIIFNSDSIFRMKLLSSTLCKNGITWIWVSIQTFQFIFSNDIRNGYHSVISVSHLYTPDSMRDQIFFGKHLKMYMILLKTRAIRVCQFIVCFE